MTNPYFEGSRAAFKISFDWFLSNDRTKEKTKKLQFDNLKYPYNSDFCFVWFFLHCLFLCVDH